MSEVRLRGEVCSTPGCVRGSFHKVPEECSVGARFKIGDRVQAHDNYGEVVATWNDWLWVKFDNQSHPVSRKVYYFERVPTNKEKLQKMIEAARNVRQASSYVAEYLDAAGVKAP